MTDLDKVIKGLEACRHGHCSICPYNNVDKDDCHYNDLLDSAIAKLKKQEPITGETSDGYHTFNELYHHRAVLFSVIVTNYPERAWKSKRHHDWTMYDGMFIVGIDTPSGQATYHYDIKPYWDMFKCRELELAPKWDGHTPAQAIERIGSLAALKTQEPFNGLCEDYGLTPEGVRHALEQYAKLLPEITCNRMSKLTYDVRDIMECVIKNFCDDCPYDPNNEE